MKDRFDLVVTSEAGESFQPPPLPFDSRLLNQRGLIQLAGELHEIQALKQRIYAAGANSPCLRITPLAYRAAKLTCLEAREIAEVERERLLQLDMPLGPLEGGFNEALFWGFSCSHKEWEAEGLIPGRVFICVDKLDGHLYSEDEKKDVWSRFF